MPARSRDSTPPPHARPASPSTESEAWTALRGVIDPELGVNVVDLGLVYDVHVDKVRVRVEMTMTTPACPLADYIRALAEEAVDAAVPDGMRVEVVLVWHPPWTPDRMSVHARRQLMGGPPADGGARARGEHPPGLPE